MRVTEQQTFSILVNNVQRSRVKALTLQQHISTGKKVVFPSDGAGAFDRIVANKASIGKVEQRVRNVNTGTTRLNLTDATLRDVSTALTRVKELAVQFRNDTNGPAERLIGAREAKQIFFQLQQLGNTEFGGGQALFTGTSRHGRATGTAITAPVTLTNGTNDTLVVKVDGTVSGTIDLTSVAAPGESLTGAQLATRLQSRINADSALLSAGRSVTVTFDVDHLTVVSNGHGPTSTVEVTSGSGLNSLGFNGGSTTGGASPFAVTAVASAFGANTGGGLLSQGRIVDPNRLTLDNYVIRFNTPAATFNVYDITAPVVVSPNPANTGGAVKADAGVQDPSQVTLDAYEIQFTSDTQFSIVETTTSTVLSAGNTYVSGGSVTFGGLKVVLSDGQSGPPKNGDRFAVSLSATTVLADQSYVSGSAITFDGVQVSITTGAATPAAGDRFRILTGVQYQGDSGVQNIEIGENQTLKTNVPGNQVLTGQTVDVYAATLRFVQALRGNYGGGIGQGLADVDASLNQVLAVQGEIGALSSQLETTSRSLEETKVFLQSGLSNDEDTDIVQAISELTLQQQALEAAGLTLNRIFENSLLKHLR